MKTHIELLKLLENNAILRTYSLYLSTDEVATICILVLPPVQHQLKAQLRWSVIATPISWIWFYGLHSCYSNSE
jgi:hypothetical protein